MTRPDFLWLYPAYPEAALTIISPIGAGAYADAFAGQRAGAQLELLAQPCGPILLSCFVQLVISVVPFDEFGLAGRSMEIQYLLFRIERVVPRILEQQGGRRSVADEVDAVELRHELNVLRFFLGRHVEQPDQILAQARVPRTESLVSRCTTFSSG